MLAAAAVLPAFCASGVAPNGLSTGSPAACAAATANSPGARADVGCTPPAAPKAAGKGAVDTAADVDGCWLMVERGALPPKNAM